MVSCLSLFGTQAQPEADLCAYIKDGLLKLYSGVRAPYYIPEMPWNRLHREIGLASDTIHLVTREEATNTVHEGNASTVLDKVLNLLDLSASQFSPEVPFTSYGMDSLAATRISEALRPYLKVSQMQLLGGMTWKHLEEKIGEVGVALDTPSRNDPASPLLEMVSKYSKNFEDHFPSTELPTEETIVITGASSSIGLSILVECLKSPNVKRVYAFNRPTTDPQNELRTAFSMWGIEPSLLDTPKLVLLSADLAAGDLGIGEILLEELRTTVTHVVHTGWSADRSSDLSQFEPSIRATRNLIDLALSSPHPIPPRIVFLSSVTVLQGC